MEDGILLAGGDGVLFVDAEMGRVVTQRLGSGRVLAVDSRGWAPTVCLVIDVGNIWELDFQRFHVFPTWHVAHFFQELRTTRLPQSFTWLGSWHLWERNTSLASKHNTAALRQVTNPVTLRFWTQPLWRAPGISIMKQIPGASAEGVYFKDFQSKTMQNPLSAVR